MGSKVDIITQMQDLSNWKTVRQKNTYTLYMCIPPLGTRIVNEIEDTEFVTNKGDVVLSGTRQEVWVTRLDKIIKNYVYVDGRPITQDTLKRKIVNGCVNWVQIKPRTFCNSLVFYIDKKHTNVLLPNGLIANKDGKPHGKGDFLVATTLKGPITDYKLVNGEIFLDTFDMRAYPGLMTKSVTSVDTTPYPKYDFCPKSIKKQVVQKTEKKVDKGQVELTDFNMVGIKSVNEIKELISNYEVVLLDVVSGKDLHSNYVKVGIYKEDMCIYSVMFTIDKDNFVVVKGNGNDVINVNLHYKSKTFSDAYKVFVKKLGLVK